MPHLAGSKFLEVDGIRVAASMAYAIGQLGNVDVNEMLIRPTAQSNQKTAAAIKQGFEECSLRSAGDGYE
jgi:hypothetical protein